MFQRNVLQAEYKNNNQNKIMPKREYNAIIAQNLFDKFSSTLITFLSKFSPCFEKKMNTAMVEALVTSLGTKSSNFSCCLIY